MTARQEFVTTVEAGWSYLFPGISIPNIKIISTWYRYYPIETALAALEEVALYCQRKGITDSEHVGAICSRNMRQHQARQLAANSAYEPPFPERA
jgi:hypothetical protein